MIFIKRFFKWLWELVKSFGSLKGLISLFISFIIFYGWLLAFIVFGTIFNIKWMYSVGIGGVLFWAGPFTPFFPIFLATATFFRKTIFKDKKGEDKDEGDK